MTLHLLTGTFDRLSTDSWNAKSSKWLRPPPGLVDGASATVECEHVVARQEAVDNKSGLEDGRHSGGHELRSLSAPRLPVRFDLYAAGEKIACVSLNLVTLIGEVLLILG
jgi:hypothetical protein